MSLKPLQAQMPLGQFDALDSIVTTVKGGEVGFFDKVVATAATDKAAYDAFDGYANPNYRAVINLATSTNHGPLGLIDDGITGYGTLFGTVVGGTVGQTSYGPNSSVPASALLGPHTATGSGKLTLWCAPGLYAVSLDATATDVQPTDAAALPGVPLYNSGSALLTRNNTNRLVGNLVEFATNGALVTTPNTLAGTFNPPDGKLSPTTSSPTFAIVWFNPAAV